MAKAILPMFWRVWLSPGKAFDALAARGTRAADWLLVAAISASIVLLDWEMTLAFGVRPALYEQVAEQQAVLSPFWRAAAAGVSTLAVFLLNWKYGAAVCHWASGLFGGSGERRSTNAFLLLWLAGGYGLLGLVAILKPLVRMLPSGQGGSPLALLAWPSSSVVAALSALLGVMLARQAFARLAPFRALGIVLILTLFSLATSTILAIGMFHIGSWLGLVPAGKPA
jgi:hypothetical protein